MDPVYIDEKGNRVDPSQLGGYEVANQNPQVQTPGTSPTSAFNLNALMQQENRVSSFISQTSPTNTLERINYILQGFVWSEEKKEWIKVTDGIPEGIRLDFLQFLTPILSEDVRMTNLDPKQINGIMQMSIEWVTDYLDEESETHDLKEVQMTKIGLILLHAEFITLLRSQSGVERGKVYGSLNIGDNLNPQQNPNLNNNSPNWWQFWK